MGIKDGIEAINNGHPIIGAILIASEILAAEELRAASAARLAVNKVEGEAFEKAVCEAQGLTVNTEKFATSHGNTVPDFKNGADVGDAKNVAKLSNTRQMRAQRKTATDNGRTHTVYTMEDTHVTTPWKRPRLRSSLQARRKRMLA